VPQDFGKLIVQQNDAVIQTVPLTDAPVTIGRTPNNTLVLGDQSVSRQHAEIRLDPRGLGPVLTDLGSANGTFVNGERLAPNQPLLLRDGTTVAIGSFVMVYQGPDHRMEEAGEIQPETRPVEQHDASLAQDGAEQPVASEAVATAPGEERTPDLSASVTVHPESATAQPRLTDPLVPPARQPAALSTNSAQPRRAGLVRMPLPLPPAQGAGSQYMYDLPVIFHDNEFLARYLQIFETIWEPLEQRQDYIEMYFDPLTSPASFLPWIAGWLGLTLNRHWPEARLRRLLAEATELYRWRGTRYGLTRMIEVCTGLTPEITDVPSRDDSGRVQAFVFRVSITIPPESDIDAAFIEELVRAHKPAHTGYVLDVR
jgi:phage tail-like protein